MWAAFYGLATAALVASWRVDPKRTREALKIGARSMHGLVPRILGMVALVGLVLAFVPPEVLRRLFAIRGLVGFALVSAIGAIVTMPGPIAFPLVGSLARLGAAPATLAAFVTTLTMVGIVTAPVEASYFGRRFTVIRQVLSFVTAIVIGLLMGVFLT
ncbi:MAG TPA: hypothetical protein VLV17_04940 [Anaeromyxobacteraceae bacterium]|nr:hypothetical protein [Anaeromyxobacteraceae bacterium]